MKFNNKVAEVWAKWFVGNLLTAVVIIAWANPKNDLTMTVKK